MRTFQKSSKLEDVCYDEQYMPSELLGKKFYHPTENGYEKNIQEYFRKIHGETD